MHLVTQNQETRPFMHLSDFCSFSAPAPGMWCK
uniref:Putative 3-beta-hydroxysteroid-Delta8 Delta7-isomerase n=1 Tax=Rhizophora mucronata TaxID=61149 RepID=A0A2P2PUI5_RHIMU